MSVGAGRAGHRAVSVGSSVSVDLQEDRNRSVSTQFPFIRRAVVLDVFYDMSLLTDEFRDELSKRVENAQMIQHIRRNCIIAQQITGDVSRTGKPRIYYPLLDPYIGLPIKPGEVVLTIYEDPAVGAADTPFWLCRAPAPITVDDINYTHDDRKYQLTKRDLDAVDKLNDEQTSSKPSFPNGAPFEDSLTIGESDDEYDRIVASSTAVDSISFEAIPRYDKRPGDTVLQGSNNTVIALTTDRTGDVTDDIEPLPDTGTIDIVAGRGRANTFSKVTNTRGFDEVDKENVDITSREGSIDFDTDASRIYVSMNTDIDGNFDINIPDGGERSPGAAPSIALKTDRLRLIGREDVKIQADAGDGQGAAIVLKANGDIVLIPGPSGVIYLGGESANLALLGSTGVNAAGSVQGQPILTTMGGVTGTPSDDPHGSFSSKILTK